MNFEDILNAPLPSAVKMERPEDPEIPYNSTEDGVPDVPVQEGADCPECEDEKEVEIDVTQNEDPADDVEVAVVGEEEPVDADAFDASAEQRMDDALTAVVAPILLSDEIGSEDEMKEFVESDDYHMAVYEGLITERTIVRFDKNAKRAQLYETAVRVCAREAKDPLYKKLMTVEKIKRTIEAKLRRKYNAPATKRVKEWLKRAQKSKSGLFAKIANKIAGNK